MIIHKEGFGTILVILLILIAINVAYYLLFREHKISGIILQVVSIGVMFIVLQFFRNPERKVAKNPYVVLSPADGTVVAIEETTEDEYFKDRRIQVSVFMSIWDVHSNRWPVGGEVTYFKHHDGDYLLAAHPKSSELNERTTIAVKNENGKEIMFRQIAGFVARRIVAPIKVGDKADQGEQFGFIKFGSRADIFLPLGTKINVKVGDKVAGGIDIIADL